jgi:hypothetical protein
MPLPRKFHLAEYFFPSLAEYLLKQWQFKGTVQRDLRRVKSGINR